MTSYLGDARLAVFKYRVQANEEAQKIVEKDIEKLLQKYELVDEVITDPAKKETLFSLRSWSTLIQFYAELFTIQTIFSAPYCPNLLLKRKLRS